jgi:hypothetical protein
MIGKFLIHTPWLVTLLWAAVYISDYSLTLYAARFFRGPLKEHVAIQGSYELTPAFQKDVDSLRRISPAFLVRLALTMLVIFLIGWLSLLVNFPGAFAFAAGGLFLLEAAIHLRHMRNIALARFSKDGQGLTGRIDYARWFTLKISASELASFSALYLLIGLIMGSWAFVGGAVFCARTALAHWKMAKKAAPQTQPA